MVYCARGGDMTQDYSSIQPMVSVGLPVFNGANYVRKAIESLLQQTYGNIEILISDNASEDDTYAICAGFAEADDRIRLSRNDTNIGAAANYNRVVHMARGEYFVWANHDDLWDPTYVERCVEVLSQDPSYVLAYAKSKTIDSAGEVVENLNSGLGLDAAQPCDRLRRYHDLFVEIDLRQGWGREPIEGFWMPVYGVIRTEALRRTPLIAKYISSDTILLEELMMIGRFHELDEYLFFKRDHPERSMRASVPYDKRTQWFTGRSSALFMFPRWRAFLDRMYWSFRLPGTAGAKCRCALEMFVFYFRRPSERNALAKEVVANLARPFLALRPGSRAFQKW
jgi:glycosyltransferase involved in cell wall biosynthesis